MAGKMEGQNPPERKKGNRVVPLRSNITGSINKPGNPPAPRPTALRPRKTTGKRM